MNEHLKFSWAHIIAFLAIIALSYTSFVGLVYLFGGDFLYAGLLTLAIDILLIGVFIGLQYMKASGEKIWRKIVWERILIVIAPIVLITALLPSAHFWNVVSQNDDIAREFQNSIGNSRQLFNDYLSYANNRIEQYESSLNQIIDERRRNPGQYELAGFQLEKESIQKENMIKTLQLQLLSDNYERINKSALNWIDGAQEGASVWNVFLLGNIEEIKEAIISWQDQLKSFSNKEMTNEAIVKDVPEFRSEGANLAMIGIDNMTHNLETQGLPGIAVILYGIILFAMLLLPYLVQQRHGRQVSMGYSVLSCIQKNRQNGMEVNSIETRYSRIKNNEDENSKENEVLSNGNSKRKFSKITLGN